MSWTGLNTNKPSSVVNSAITTSLSCCRRIASRLEYCKQRRGILHFCECWLLLVTRRRHCFRDVCQPHSSIRSCVCSFNFGRSEAPSTPATMSKQHCGKLYKSNDSFDIVAVLATKSNVASTLLLVWTGLKYTALATVDVPWRKSEKLARSRVWDKPAEGSIGAYICFGRISRVSPCSENQLNSLAVSTEHQQEHMRRLDIISRLSRILFGRVLLL